MRSLLLQADKPFLQCTVQLAHHALAANEFSQTLIGMMWRQAQDCRLEMQLKGER